MIRSRWLAAVVLLGVVWASPNLEAQSMKGINALTAGEYEQAISILKAAAQGGSEKDRLGNYYFLGMTYYRNKQSLEAIAAYEEALKHTAKANELTVSVYTIGCYGELGQAYLDHRQYQQAGSNFLNAANGCLNWSRLKSGLWNPDPAVWERKAGLYYGLLGRAHVLDTTYQEAVNAYKKAMELDPVNGLHFSGLALAYVGLKQYDDALAAAKRGVELAPNSQASYGTLGDVYAVRKEYDQAIVAYRKAVEVAPMQLAADQEYEEKYTGKSLSQKVYDQLREAVKTASAGFCVKSGQMSDAIGDYAGAVEAINNAAELTPNDPDLYYRLGMIQARSGKFDEAIASLDKAIGLRKLITPKDAAPYYGSRSLCAREKGDREGAVKDAGLAYSLDPDNGGAREALAAVSLDGGNAEEAIKLLSTLKDDPFARVLEATAYAKRNEFSRAIAIYSAIPQDDPSVNSALTQNALGSLKQAFRALVQERLEKAGTSESLGRFADALAEYSGAVKLADEATAGSIRQRVAIILKNDPRLAELPEEARKYALRGDVLIKEGGFADAFSEYRTALGIAPFNAQLYFNTALICGQLKDYRRAIKSMTIYLQLDPDAANARAAKDEIYKWEFALEKERKK